jgi:hypothetical protein
MFCTRGTAASHASFMPRFWSGSIDWQVCTHGSFQGQKTVQSGSMWHTSDSPWVFSVGNLFDWFNIRKNAGFPMFGQETSECRFPHRADRSLVNNFARKPKKIHYKHHRNTLQITSQGQGCPVVFEGWTSWVFSRVVLEYHWGFSARGCSVVFQAVIWDKYPSLP